MLLRLWPPCSFPLKEFINKKDEEEVWKKKIQFDLQFLQLKNSRARACLKVTGTSAVEEARPTSSKSQSPNQRTLLPASPLFQHHYPALRKALAGTSQEHGDVLLPIALQQSHLHLRVLICLCSDRNISLAEVPPALVRESRQQQVPGR